MLQLSAHKDILVRTLVHDGSRSFRILKYLTIWWISRVFFGGGLGWQGFLGSGHVAIQFGVLPPVSHNLDGVVSGEGKLRATTRGAAHPALAPQIRFDFQDDDDDDDDDDHDDDRSAGQLVLYYNPCTMETWNSNTFKTLRHYRFCTNDPFQVGESLIVSDCSLIYWEAPVFFLFGCHWSHMKCSRAKQYHPWSNCCCGFNARQQNLTEPPTAGTGVPAYHSVPSHCIWIDGGLPKP